MNNRKVVGLKRGIRVHHGVYHFVTVTVQRSDGATWLVTAPYLDRRNLRAFIKAVQGE